MGDLNTENEDTTEVTTDNSVDNGIESSSDEVPQINPAWSPVLEIVPEEFHSRMTPTFDEWDKNFQKVQQKYAPYKDIVERGVSVDDIQQALTLGQLLVEKPREVFDYLNNQHNFIPSGQQDLTGPKTEVDPEEYDLSETIDLENHPRFKEMQSKLETFEKGIQADAERREREQAQAQVDADINAVKTAFPNLDINEVITLAVGKATIQKNDPNLMQAAQELAEKNKPRVSDTAPPVFSGNRGLPKDGSVDLSDKASRKSYLAEQMRLLNSN